MSVRHDPPPQWQGRTDPEDGESARRLHHLAGREGAMALLGFACEAGVARNKGRPGAREGPAAIRAAMANLAASPGHAPFADLGTITVEGDALEEGQALLGETLCDALTRHERVVVLGGGHETAFGSYLGLRAAYREGRIGIINLDAHFDLRLPGPAGPSSGTPFQQIREREGARFAYLCLGIAEEANTLALVERARAHGVEWVSDTALLEDPAAGEGAIRDLVARSDLLYLTIDIDVLPHWQAPGVSAPAVRGVPFPVIERLVGTIRQVCRDAGKPLPLADIVEVSPPHDRDGMTARTAAYLARQLLSLDPKL